MLTSASSTSTRLGRCLGLAERGLAVEDKSEACMWSLGREAFRGVCIHPASGVPSRCCSGSVTRDDGRPWRAGVCVCIATADCVPIAYSTNVDRSQPVLDPDPRNQYWDPAPQEAGALTPSSRTARGKGDTPSEDGLIIGDSGHMTRLLSAYSDVPTSAAWRPPASAAVCVGSHAVRAAEASTRSMGLGSGHQSAQSAGLLTRVHCPDTI